jgi:hypothetical protein
MQFQNPIPVLREVSRILKPGGLAGFREPCFAHNLSEPPDSAQDRLWKLFGRVLAHNGGDIDIGLRLGALLRSTGFGALAMSASFSGSWTPEANLDTCERNARLCEEAGFMKQAICSWVDRGRCRGNHGHRAPWRGARSRGVFRDSVARDRWMEAGLTDRWTRWSRSLACGSVAVPTGQRVVIPTRETGGGEHGQAI